MGPSLASSHRMGKLDRGLLVSLVAIVALVGRVAGSDCVCLAEYLMV